MARAIAINCPHCGASLQASEDSPQTTCSYCGKMCIVRGRTRFFQVPVQPSIRVPPGIKVAIAPARWWIPLVSMVVVFIGIGAIPILVFVSKGGFGKGGSTASKPMWDGQGPPLLADVDGDATADVIGLARYVYPVDHMNLAAYSGVTGKRLWESPSLGNYNEVYQGTMSISGDLILRSTSAGEVRAFALADGAPRWQANLGEQLHHWCYDPDVVRLVTKDRVVRTLDRATGAVAAPASEPLPISDFHNGTAVGDCVHASATDVGSWGFTVEEHTSALRAPVPGMRIDTRFSRTDGVTLVSGSRSEGTSVPMLARLDGDKVLWQVQVPALNPLTARSEEDLLTIANGVVAVIYNAPELPTPHLTGFDLTDGRRVWDVPIGKGPSIVLRGMASNGHAIFVSSWGHLQAFDPATGAALFMIGKL